MRSTLPALLMCGLALLALGAHHANTLLAAVLPQTPARECEDVYSSAAAARHRAAQPPHWGSMVLVPRR